MTDTRQFWLCTTLSILTFFFLVVLPQSLGEYFSRYPNISLQLGLYLTSLALGTLFLTGFRDRVTCIWLAIAMLVNYSIYAYLISHAKSINDLNSASLIATCIWAVLLYCRGYLNRKLFFVLGIIPTLRPLARQYLRATPPSTFQQTINYYIAVCLLFDVCFTLIWRILPLYFGKLINGSLHQTFLHHGWPDLFDVYYDLNNLLAFILVLLIPAFIIIESLNQKNPN